MKQFMFKIMIGLCAITAWADNSSPSNTVKTYYGWYIKCAGNENLKNPCYEHKPSTEYVDNNLLAQLKKSDIDYDYFVHSQDIDADQASQTFKITTIDAINPTRKRVNVYMKSWDEPINIKVYVKNISGKWKIYKVE